MTTEERRVAARERVRAWKKNPGKQWSLSQQRKRWYAKRKARARERRGVEVRLRIEEVGPIYGETHEEAIEYSETCDPSVVEAQNEAYAKRKGVAVPERFRRKALETESKMSRRGTVRASGPEADELGPEPAHRGAAQSAAPIPLSAEEARVAAWVKKKQGVVVELDC